MIIQNQKKKDADDLVSKIFQKIKRLALEPSFL